MIRDVINRKVKNVLLMISIITLLIIIYIPASSYITKQNIISKVLEETEITKITRITRAKIGKPYVMVYGSNRTSDSLVAWIDSVNRQHNPTIKYITDLKNGLSREEALRIADENNIDKIELCELSLISEQRNALRNDKLINIDFGLYWQIYYDQGKEALIDFRTGKMMKLDE